MLEKSTQHRTSGTGTSDDTYRFRPVVLLAGILIWSLFPASGLSETEELPSVIILEIPEVTPYDNDLYRAIRAQLSATPIVLRRLSLSEAQFQTDDAARSTAMLAAEQQAAMVFWIQDDGSVCTLFFYIATEKPPRIRRRVVDLVSESRPSRFEVIGNAAASIVEASLTGAAATQKSDPPPPPRQKSEPPKKRNRMELFADYAGTLFSPGRTAHGVQLGWGFLPTDHTAVNMSYTQSLPLTWDTPQYSLTLTPHVVNASLAGRLVSGAVDFRLGIAWSLDLRTYSTRSDAETITPRRGAADGIHSLGPFISIVFTVIGRFGIKLGVSADIALNERNYLISRDDGSDVAVQEPFLTKFSWQTGLVLEL